MNEIKRLDSQKSHKINWQISLVPWEKGCEQLSEDFLILQQRYIVPLTTLLNLVCAMDKEAFVKEPSFHGSSHCGKLSQIST